MDSNLNLIDAENDINDIVRYYPHTNLQTQADMDDGYFQKEIFFDRTQLIIEDGIFTDSIKT